MCCFKMVACGLLSTQEVVVCRLNTRVVALHVKLDIYVLCQTQPF